MRLVMAIFGLLSTLSAQVICCPADPKASPDLSLFDREKIASTHNNLPVNRYRLTDYPSRRLHCFEHANGTVFLNGKIVHGFWIELKPLERWMSDAPLCSASRSKEPLFRFMDDSFEWQQQETKTKPVTIPAEFCRLPLATDN